MALRLTADARLQFCLLREDVVVDLRPYLGSHAALSEAVKGAISIYQQAVFNQEPPSARESRDLALPVL